MKMIVAILDNNKAEQISKILLNADFRVTRLASTGGFLREGQTTLMVGVDDEKVETALQFFRDNLPPKDNEIQATLYVLKVRNFQRV